MLYSFRYDGITLIEEMLNVENHLCKSRSSVCKLKRNCCLIFNFVLEHMYNVNYLKEENFFVKGAKIWSNLEYLRWRFQVVIASIISEKFMEELLRVMVSERKCVRLITLTFALNLRFTWINIEEKITFWCH